MDQTTWWMLVALLFGVLLGTVVTVIIFLANKQRSHISSVIEQDLPDGVDEVLLAIDSVGIVLDSSMSVVRVSPGAVRMGLTREQALVYPDLVRLVELVRDSGEALNESLVIKRPGLATGDLFLTVRVAGLGLRYMLILVRDVTEAKMVEQVRSDFLANVSHELKTPIGAVKLLAEAIESAKDSPADVARFTSRLSAEADRLGRLSGEIIELHRLQSSVEPGHKDQLSVDEIVATAVDQSRVIANDKQIQLAIGGAKGTQVIGDLGQLISAVSNLVANAISYSPDQSRVGIGVKETADQIEISITDQGIGIPLEEQERIFERFYRVDAARARNTGGTGLGLSIVKHIIRIHGGDVRVWSQPSRGSTFTICLPKS